MVQWRRSGAPPPTAGRDNSKPCSVTVLKDEEEEEEFWREIPGTDVRVLTSAGKSIPAHSSVLASASPVLESLVNRRPLKRGSGDREDDDDSKKDRRVSSIVVPILGVPHNAVVSFLGCLYDNAGFSRSLSLTDKPASESAAPSPAVETSNDAATNGVHHLVLSHALQVPWLKRSSASALAGSLTPENVVDMLQLARLCDAPGLQVRCMALIRRHFKAVQRTEGWRFMQKNDALLELEVLEKIEEDEKSDRRRRQGRREIGVYAELGEALQCLEHICYQGCHLVGPKDQQQQQHQHHHQQPGKDLCAWGHMCRGLQQLILHFASCDRRKRSGHAAGGCGRCTRMWQLLRLHSAVCSDHNNADSGCKVPFCRQFKEKAAQTTQVAGADRWQLLAKKVGSAKVILNVSKSKRDQHPQHEPNHSETATAAPTT